MKLKIIRQIIVMVKYGTIGLFLQAFLGGILYASNSLAQKSIDEIEVVLQSDNISLTQLIETIEEKTNFYFSYENNVIAKNEQFVFPSGTNTLGDILRHVSQKGNLTFKRINDNIIVKKRTVFSPPIEEVITTNVAQMKISGTVLDGESGDPLPGVSILIKGTASGTTTDIDGAYNIEASSEDVLQFSYIGYLTQEITVGNQSAININLAADIAQLEEVMVIGYGTVKKSDLTGSVSSVKGEELTAYPSVGAVQALQGRAAGLQVTANNGEPGADFKVRVRGGTSINASSDPIFVIDGFVGGTLPPAEDIESMEVLKDASATAIYGSRGANGVIMVTTKKGREGKMRVDFRSSFSSQEVISKLDLLNGTQFAEYVNEGTPGFYDLNNIENTDWQDEIFRTGSIKNYQLSFSGGNDKVSYYVSGVYYDQEGILIESNYKRYSLTTNLDFKASDKFKLGLNLFARRADKNGSLTQEGSGGADNVGVVAAAFKFEPTLGIYNADGTYTRNRVGDPHDNPVAVARERTNQDSEDRLQTNFYGEYSILNNLKFRVSAGGAINYGRLGQYTSTLINAGANVGGDAGIYTDRNTVVLNENYFTYNKKFGLQHDFEAIGGYSYQSSSSESWGAHSQSFITDAVSFWDLDGGSVYQSPSSDISEWEISSWYSRLKYNFDDRLLLTFTARYDGSSIFSEGNKWAFFPSGAIAWNIGNEAFMSGIEAISDMKLRASYGKTGNRAIGPYQTLARFSSQFTVIGGVPVNAVRPTSVANDNLSWETTTQTDIGLDVGLFGGRLNIVTDYYYMRTNDLLFSVPLPEYSGYGTQLQNIGVVENKGFEFSVNSNNLVGEFQWSTGFNISLNRNKILELPDGNEIQYSSGPGHMVGIGNTQVLREGQPVGVFYGYIYDGVYQEGDEFISGSGFEQEAGGEKYRDISGRDDNNELTNTPDGQLNNDDRTIIGDPNPDFIWGLNNDFKYKNFDLNIFFQASVGNDIYNFSVMELDRLSASNNATTAALNRWTPTNTDTDIPKVNTSRAYKPSTRWVEDGSFIRLKNIALGYNLPTVATEKLKIRSARIYVSAQNLLTFTDYTGFDPEVNYRTSGSTNGNRNLGLDYGSYPNAKSYTVGLNIGF